MTTEAAKPQDEKHLEIAHEPVADAANPEDLVAGAEAAQHEDREPGEGGPRSRSPIRSQVDRLSIGDKFSKQRQDAEDQIGFTGSHADLTTIAGKLTQEQPDDPPDEGDGTTEKDTTGARESGPSDSPASAKRKIKVRGEEREIDDEELLRLAQLGAGGESYLTEARTKLEQAEDVLRRAKSPQPPGAAEPAAHTAERTTDEPKDPQHPAEDLTHVVEKIQFGSPEEGAAALQEVIAKAVAKGQDPEVARKAVYAHQHQMDLARATTTFNAFKEQNAELFANDDAVAVLETRFQKGLVEDLRKLGIPEDQIPKDRDRLRETHRFHRIHGQPVRDTAALLAASKQGFEEFKGTGAKPQPPTGERKVVVNLDRTERRAGISPQPARSGVPAPAITSPKPVQSARSEAVRDIAKGRRRIVIT